MKNKNVPKCIREGIFCLMTGAMVFMGSGLEAHAAEELPTEDPISTELDTSTNLATAEAKELVSIPSEPTSSETTIVDNVTTIENTYVESTETATATTEETTIIVTNSIEDLTKDTENVTVVTEDNKIITSGEYIEDVKTTTTKSETTVVTDNEDTADALETLVKAEETKNTADKGINFESRTTNYFDEDGTDVTSTAEDFVEKTEIAIEDATFKVTKDNGIESVSYDAGDGYTVLDDSFDDLKQIIIKSAKLGDETVTYTTSTKAEITDDIKAALNKINTNNIVFTILPISATEYQVTYKDAEGVAQKVTDPTLKQFLVNQLGKEGITSTTIDYNGSTEYKNAADAESEVADAIAKGFIDAHTVEGSTTHTETYSDPTVYQSRKAAEDAAELLKEAINGGYTDFKITEIPGQESQIIVDFDGFAVTSEAEYNRIRDKYHLS